MSQEFYPIGLAVSGAEAFSDIENQLNAYKSQLDDDFYILDNVPELLSEINKGGGKTTITLPSGKTETVSFADILQVFNDFSNIQSEFSDLDGAKLSKDVSELNSALKTALSGYNDLKVPVGTDTKGNPAYARLVDKSTGKPANAWELLQSWNKGGSDNEEFTFKVKNKIGVDIKDQKWTMGHSFSAHACTHGDHHQDYTDPNNKDASISCVRHEDGCGHTKSWDFNASAEAIAPYLQYDHVDSKGHEKPYSGQSAFDGFLKSHGWTA